MLEVEKRCRSLLPRQFFPSINTTAISHSLTVTHSRSPITQLSSYSASPRSLIIFSSLILIIQSTYFLCRLTMLSTLQAELAKKVHSGSDSTRIWRLTSTTNGTRKSSLYYDPTNLEELVEVIRQVLTNNGSLDELIDGQTNESHDKPETNNTIDREPAPEDVPIISSAVDSASDPPGADLGGPDGNSAGSNYIHKLIVSRRHHGLRSGAAQSSRALWSESIPRHKTIPSVRCKNRSYQVFCFPCGEAQPTEFWYHERCS